jgi:RNA polymerase sigma factor (sigma-70 family)
MSQGRQATTIGARLERGDSARAQSDAARKRAAIEMIAEHEGALKRTARRYSLDAEDAEDAYQRALEIVLTKAPTTDPRELIRWTQTVTKHEALALRQSRERLLGYGGPKAPGGVGPDLIALIPAAGDSPEEQVERREAIARSREALQALKPAELRALSLLAEGYSYVEIGELTGFSQTKINRVLAEGRDRFRSLVSSSEDGSRCRQLGPLLSAFCDGEASERDAEAVREHLRACGRCRSTMRAYRAAPRIAVALAPALPPSRSLLGRAHELIAGLGSRLPGIGGAGDSAAVQIAATGGSRGAGMVALAKLLALCAGAAGGVACVATGVLPAPDLTPQHTRKPAIERSSLRRLEAQPSEAVQYEPAPAPAPEPEPTPKPAPKEEPEGPSTEAAGAPTGAVEYEPPPPPPAPEPPSASGSEGSSSGSAAGEFGP